MNKNNCTDYAVFDTILPQFVPIMFLSILYRNCVNLVNISS